MSLWWLVPLGLGSVAATVARHAAGRLRREHEELRLASTTIGALVVAVAAGPPSAPG